MKINRENVRQAFQEYIEPYDIKDVKIALKVDHTYRVAEICDAIARGEGLSKEEQDLAWLCGMLHDIGRFEQLRRYNTFVDAKSIDHARFGASLLFEEGLIRRFCADSLEDDLIQAAVYWHSAYRLPEEMDERTAMFANILRDADKADIFRVCIDTPVEEIYNATTEELKHSQVSEAVMESFHEEHATLRSLKKTVVDNIVGHISLAYELVYPSSRKLVEEQGYLEQLMQFQSDNPVTRQQFDAVREHMHAYLREGKAKVSQASL